MAEDNSKKKNQPAHEGGWSRVWNSIPVLPSVWKALTWRIFADPADVKRHDSIAQQRALYVAQMERQNILHGSVLAATSSPFSHMPHELQKLSEDYNKGIRELWATRHCLSEFGEKMPTPVALINAKSPEELFWTPGVPVAPILFTTDPNEPDASIAGVFKQQAARMSVLQRHVLARLESPAGTEPKVLDAYIAEHNSLAKSLYEARTADQEVRIRAAAGKCKMPEYEQLELPGLYKGATDLGELMISRRYPRPSIVVGSGVPAEIRALVDSGKVIATHDLAEDIRTVSATERKMTGSYDAEAAMAAMARFADMLAEQQKQHLAVLNRIQEENRQTVLSLTKQIDAARAETAALRKVLPVELRKSVETLRLDPPAGFEVDVTPRVSIKKTEEPTFEIAAPERKAAESKPALPKGDETFVAEPDEAPAEPEVEGSFETAKLASVDAPSAGELPGAQPSSAPELAESEAPAPQSDVADSTSSGEEEPDPFGDPGASTSHEAPGGRLSSEAIAEIAAEIEANSTGGGAPAPTLAPFAHAVARANARSVAHAPTL